MSPITPLARQIASVLPRLRAEYHRQAEERGDQRTLERVLTDMETVAKDAFAARGCVTTEDLRRAGMSMNGVVSEPLVGGMRRAFTAREIELFHAHLFSGLRQVRADRAAFKQVADAAARDRRHNHLQAAALALTGFVGGLSGVAAIAHLFGVA